MGTGRLLYMCHLSLQCQEQNDNGHACCFSHLLLLTFFEILSRDLGQTVGRRKM